MCARGSNIQSGLFDQRLSYVCSESISSRIRYHKELGQLTCDLTIAHRHVDCHYLFCYMCLYEKVDQTDKQAGQVIRA